jgi:protein-S-isoprenylcysteine O-methyltransferase Ste14
VTDARAPHRPAAPPVARALLALIATGLDAVLLALALGGIAPLLAHPRAPALLGLWAVGAVALALRQPVRGHDAASVKRETPWLLLALLLLPLLAAPAAAFGERLGRWPLPGGATLGWCGVALSGLGLALRIAAMAQLGPRFSPLLAMQREHALETRGLYARLRHPGYLGTLLAAMGGALAFGSAAGLPLVVALGVLLWARAGREEAMLERHFGDAYRRYRARSGRLLPRLAPPPEGGR